MNAIYKSHIPYSYDLLLSQCGTEFIESEYYLASENTPIKLQQGWLLYIPLNYTESESFILSIVPILLENKMNFKVVKNSIIHKKMNNGEYGVTMMGRNIIIQLDDISQSKSLFNALNSILESYKGLVLSYDYKIGPNLYARYGSYQDKILEDGIGNFDRIIMDSSGKWFRDKYRTPPILPNGISNPFENLIRSMPETIFYKTLNKKYKIEKQIFQDIWGAIYEGSLINNESTNKKCYIFRGKRKTLLDDNNRDIYDRLEWASETMKNLKSVASIPTIIDFWKEENQAFLVISRVESQSLRSMTKKISQNQFYNKAHQNQKEALIDILIRVANAIANINRLGYINRHIDFDSVFISPNLDITLLRWDNCYYIPNNTPSPIFQLPKQIDSQFEGNQSTEERTDINMYSSLVASVLSGFSEGTIAGDDIEELQWEKLNHITDHEELKNIIVRCLSKKNSDKPNWVEIITCLERYKKHINHKLAVNQIYPNISKSHLASITQAALKALSTKRFSAKNTWFSPIQHPYDIHVYPLGNKHFSPSLYKGVSGVIYLLMKALRLGYDINDLAENLETSLNFFLKKTIENNTQYLPGLYYGTSGGYSTV